MAGVHNRGEGGNGGVAFGIFQRDLQSAVAAHAVPHDAAFIGYRKVRFNQRRQFVYHIVIHLIMSRPRLFGGVYIKTGALPQIVTRRIGHCFATRAGVGHHQGHAPVSGIALTLRAPLADDFASVIGQLGWPLPQSWA